MTELPFTYAVHETPLDYEAGIAALTEQLDQQRGMVMSSGIDYPGRYTQWDIGVINPPLELIARSRQVTVKALNPRGVFLLDCLLPLLVQDSAVKVMKQEDGLLIVEVEQARVMFTEESRSKQPSVVTPLRTVINAFTGFADSAFGFYGAFGYEMIFQFDAIRVSADRAGNEKVFHLFFVDEVHVVDRRREQAKKLSLVLIQDGQASDDIDNTPFETLLAPAGKTTVGKDLSVNYNDQAFADMVDAARERMRVGDIFEVVLSRRFKTDFAGKPSALFKKMQGANPSPYEFYCQLGDEQLVGTSPEMFVRVNGQRIESCPISGSRRRGHNAMEDERQIRDLLNSYKDEVELTMCTDVDRNDKSRICVPGSVKLLARRTIERYIGLFHTVDHVEGTLRPEFNGLDGFLSHMWAVTLTGAPKKEAVQIIEDMEKQCRYWYGGAVGRISLNGDVSSAITIRTIHLREGKAEYQVGATLVWDSVGEEEVDETHAKATPYYRALGLKDIVKPPEHPNYAEVGKGYRAIMIDNQDSFVHTLADYFRQCGMQVDTYRAGVSIEKLLEEKPDLVIHSPGPKRPQDFGVPSLVWRLAESKIPQFGVCLGLQGIVEAFGGELGLLNVPRHGKTWKLMHEGKGVMEGVPMGCSVAAYHSIIARKDSLPDCLEVLAENEVGDVMAICHKTLPIQATQFHPESILSMQDNVGLSMICNVINQLVKVEA